MNDRAKLKVLDLFSGIGGFSLGLERTGGFRTVAFCEIDPFCRRVLRKHWPDVPIFEDVRTLWNGSMSLPEASPARTFPSPGSAPAWPGLIQDSTGSWCEPFAWFDRATASWRTWQRCLVMGWEPFSETWPRAGLTLNGIAYRRAPSAPLTNGTGFGLLPTPTASTGGREPDGKTGRKLVTVLKRGPLPMLPTPTVKGDNNRKGASPTSGDGLATVLKRGLPTPRASDADKGGRGDLLTVLRGYETKHAGTLPTPTARDWRSGKASDATHGKNARPLNEALTKMAGNLSGRMNPRFREWMMGYPIGWTEFAPPATRSCRKSRTHRRGDPRGPRNDARRGNEHSAMIDMQKNQENRYSGNSLFWPKKERVINCRCEECADGQFRAKWPMVDDEGGCSWGRMDWPRRFETVPNPLSRSGNLLKTQI
jgi:hypothetical protein